MLFAALVLLVAHSIVELFAQVSVGGRVELDGNGDADERQHPRRRRPTRAAERTCEVEILAQRVSVTAGLVILVFSVRVDRERVLFLAARALEREIGESAVRRRRSDDVAHSNAAARRTAKARTLAQHFNVDDDTLRRVGRQATCAPHVVGVGRLMVVHIGRRWWRRAAANANALWCPLIAVVGRWGGVLVVCGGDEEGRGSVDELGDERADDARARRMCARDGGGVFVVVALSLGVLLLGTAQRAQMLFCGRFVERLAHV